MHLTNCGVSPVVSFQGDDDVLCSVGDVDWMSASYRNRPRGYECVGYIDEDGTMLFDENGKICNADRIKEKISKGETVFLSAKFVEHTFTLILDTDGGIIEYGDERTEIVYENMTYETIVKNGDKYFKDTWLREGSSFEGWKKIEEDGTLSENFVPSIKYDKTFGSAGFRETWFDPFYELTDTMRFKAIYNEYGVAPWVWCKVDVYSFENGAWTRCYLKADAVRWMTKIGEPFTKHLEYDPKRFGWRTRENTVLKWSRSPSEYIPFDGTVNCDMKLFCYEVDYKKYDLNPMNGDEVGEFTVYINNDYETSADNWVLIPPDGYVFGGWYQTRDCEGEPVSMEELPKFSEAEHGATYYAKWIRG